MTKPETMTCPNCKKEFEPELSVPDPDDDKYSNALKRRMLQVLSSDIDNVPPTLGSTYIEDQYLLFAWYKYLFIDGSKPVTHMRAMLGINDQELVNNCPEVLSSLMLRAQTLSSNPNGDE